MQWLNPAGAWALAAPVIILALYLLRRKYIDTPVPSTYLWRKAVADNTASTPFQKLKKNLLMYLQLALSLLLALALMRPLLPGAASGGELLLIVDVSASMGASEGSGTRLDAAVSEARALIEGMGAGGRASVIVAGAISRQALARSEDKAEASRVLADLEVENGVSDMAGALSLAQALRRELPDMRVYIFSDDFDWQSDMDVNLIAPFAGADNARISRLNASESADGIAAVARVTNYGAARDISVSLYADGELCDVRRASVEGGGAVSVQLSAPTGASVLEARLDGEDALAIDDACWHVMETGEAQRVALSGEGNVFLENAISLISGVTLLRFSASEDQPPEDCAIYVLDGDFPEALPEEGALIAFSGSVPGITAGEMKAAEEGITVAPSARFVSGLTFERVAIKEYMPLTGGEPVLMCGDDVVLAVSEEGGRRVAAFGFDLHDSNLPLKYDFPVLISRLAEYLTPDALAEVTEARLGETVNITPSARAASVSVTSPSGREMALPLSETREAGLYTLTQTLTNGETLVQRFALLAPEDESDVTSVPQSAYVGGEAGATSYGFELRYYIIAAALLLLLAEWWVSRRAN